MTVRALSAELSDTIAGALRAEGIADADVEARDAVSFMWGVVKGWSGALAAFHADSEVGPDTERRLRQAADDMASGVPLQYALHVARFYGMDFYVDPSVLIPRPETEEMVDMIVDSNCQRKDLDVIDLCTGSGCIAIALARNLPFVRVEATDLSYDALGVARRNAEALRASVRFEQTDVLTMTATPDSYDIIVSNPPYVCQSESAAMSPRVLDHEPHEALFVPDSDPLRFYIPIVRFAAGSLRSAGQLWMEVNPLHADGVVRLCREAGLMDVETINDTTGRKRFIKACR